MFNNKSHEGASSNILEIFWIKLFSTKSLISFLLTLVPISFSLRSDLMPSITSIATSDSKRDISS